MNEAKQYIDSEELHENNSSIIVRGEMLLWRSVITKALEDLALPASNKRYRLWQKQAQQWFDKKDDEFLLVCEYAEISPAHILKLARAIIANGDPYGNRTRVPTVKG